MTRLILTLLTTLFLLTPNVSRAASETAAAPDTLEQLKPDYILASLLVVSPSAEPYSLFGHCALRLQCPDHDMDYCFTFETPTDTKGLFDFFRGKAMGGFAAAPTHAYLKYYSKAGRSVVQHLLNLTPKEKLMLWQQADKEIVRGNCYRYNYLHTQCASTIIDLITSVLPTPVDYQQLPAQTKGSFRDQMLVESEPYPWSRFFWQTIMGPAGDEVFPLEHKLTPRTLAEAWRQATVGDDHRHLISHTAVCNDVDAVDITPSATAISPLSHPSYLFTILLIIVVLVTAAQWCFGWRRLPKVTDFLLAVIYTLLALFLMYLVLFSDLEATQWNWYLLAFNPIPLLLWALRPKWLPYICFGLTMAIIILLLLTPFIPQLDVPHALFMAIFGTRAASETVRNYISVNNNNN